MTSAMSSRRQELGIGDKRGELAGAHAEAVESGIDVQRRRRRAGAALRQRGPGARLIEARQTGRTPMPASSRAVSGKEAVENVDGGAGGERDGRLRFRLRRDEEAAAAGLVQCRDHSRGAEPIGIRLDDGTAPGRRDVACERAPVGAHLRQIDGDDAGGAGRNLCGLRPLDDAPRGLRRRSVFRRRVHVPVRHGRLPAEARMSDAPILRGIGVQTRRRMAR